MHVDFVAEVSSNHHRDLARCVAFIDAAAGAKKVSPFKATFSDGVMKYLEKALGESMPRPAYFSLSRSIGELGANHPVCIYAIRRGDLLEENWRLGEPFSFQEGRSWAGAAKELAAAREAKATLPILFADARLTICSPCHPRLRGPLCRR